MRLRSAGKWIMGENGNLLNFGQQTKEERKKNSTVIVINIKLKKKNERKRREESQQDIKSWKHSFDKCSRKKKKKSIAKNILSLFPNRRCLSERGPSRSQESIAAEQRDAK